MRGRFVRGLGVAGSGVRSAGAHAARARAARAAGAHVRSARGGGGGAWGGRVRGAGASGLAPRRPGPRSLLPRSSAERRPVAWDADRLQAALNVFGGLAFSAGSLLFLDDSLMRLGIGLFVLGSFGMAAGAIAVWWKRYARPDADAPHLPPDEP